MEGGSRPLRMAKYWFAVEARGYVFGKTSTNRISITLEHY